MDKELFELCKSVYENTGWEYTVKISCNTAHPGQDIYHPQGHQSLYTSDYLLEKLAQYEPFVGMTLTDSWVAYTKNFNIRKGGQYIERQTSALKALLKLILALHEAGEL